jgi:hypothetical protein
MMPSSVFNTAMVHIGVFPAAAASGGSLAVVVCGDDMVIVVDEYLTAIRLLEGPLRVVRATSPQCETDETDCWGEWVKRCFSLLPRH